MSNGNRASGQRPKPISATFNIGQVGTRKNSPVCFLALVVFWGDLRHTSSLHDAPKGTLFYRLKLSPPGNRGCQTRSEHAQINPNYDENLEKRSQPPFPGRQHCMTITPTYDTSISLPPYPDAYTRMSSNISSRKQHTSRFHSGDSWIGHVATSLAGACIPQPMKIGKYTYLPACRQAQRQKLSATSHVPRGEACTNAFLLYLSPLQLSPTPYRATGEPPVYVVRCHAA